MGYLHIDNLYKNQTILQFKSCWVLEKVHGTSAHVSWKAEIDKLNFSAGGESHTKFVALFQQPILLEKFKSLPYQTVTVFGEAYGGKQQGMKHVYGDELHFIVFDVYADSMWMDVPTMAKIAAHLGLEVVPYQLSSTDLLELNEHRDTPSEVAKRRGMGEDKPREGIVLRPPFEVELQDGTRLIAKHKGEAFAEMATPRTVDDPAKLTVLVGADAIALEWVTPMRLEHVMQQLREDDKPLVIQDTPKVIRAMLEDVHREAAGEFVPSKAADAAISRTAAKLFKQHLNSLIRTE
jgi:hypothetical protein